MGPGKVEVQSIDFPKLELGSRKCQHGVILKIVTTNICGSDQHMVRGRTTAPLGLVLGHEITGEIIEAGREFANLNWLAQSTEPRFHWTEADASGGGSAKGVVCRCTMSQRPWRRRKMFVASTIAEEMSF
jgi:hypothetical protein